MTRGAGSSCAAGRSASLFCPQHSPTPFVDHQIGLDERLLSKIWAASPFISHQLKIGMRESTRTDRDFISYLSATATRTLSKLEHDERSGAQYDLPKRPLFSRIASRMTANA